MAWGIVSSRLLDVFIQPDHLNTPRLIANQAGVTVWRNDNTEPFGNSVPNNYPDGDGVAFDFSLRFPGQYFDRETFTHYNYFRDCYDPVTGRYCESDPIGLRGGMNTYLYVRGDPLAFIDPYGERRAGPLPGPFLGELRKQLLEPVLDQGARTATTPDGIGQAVGRYICVGTFGNVSSGWGACMSGGCTLLQGAGYEAMSDCTNACIDEIKRKCNPKCPP